MINWFKAIYHTTLDALAIDNETPTVVAFVRRAVGADDQAVVLDIGCGYGRTLRALRLAGMEAVGIDINPSIVESTKSGGLKCLLAQELESKNVIADVLIMSHVIEHFSPEKLLDFVDSYLDRLRPGGHLIVATPLLHPRFFDDFDHVKPYHPTGMTMVFGPGAAQVQYFSRNRLELIDVWFRRSPFAVNFARGLYIKDWTTRLWQILNLAGALLFRASGGMVGRPTGWVGLFRKMDSAQ